METHYTQYRLTIGDRTTYPTKYPADWGYLLSEATERGVPVSLGSRLVVRDPDECWLAGLRDLETGKLPEKSMLVAGLYCSPWTVLADNSDRSGVLIGGHE